MFPNQKLTFTQLFNTEQTEQYCRPKSNETEPNLKIKTLFLFCHLKHSVPLAKIKIHLH